MASCVVIKWRCETVPEIVISRKSQYALRAVLELARRAGQGPIRIQDIAGAHGIPVHSLESVLSELKKGGYVRSRRGKNGGYELTCDPAEVTVEDILLLIAGPIRIDGCTEGYVLADCPQHGRCVFISLWDRAKKAVEQVCRSSTFAELLEGMEGRQAAE